MQQMEPGTDLTGPPDLREMISAAILALSRLDASRLEELAVSCQALRGSFKRLDEERYKAWVQRSRGARGDVKMLGHVLESTRSNLLVVRSVRELGIDRLEYSVEPTSIVC